MTSHTLIRTYTQLPHTERPSWLSISHMDPGPHLLHTRPFGATSETAGDDLSGHRCCGILPRPKGNLSYLTHSIVL